MNVLFVSDSTTVSGAEIVLLECVDALSARGDMPLGFVREENSRLIQAFRSRGVPITPSRSYSNQLIRTTADPMALSTFARSLLAVRREMAAVICAAGVNVIHSISYPASLYASFAARMTRTAHIWHEHNIKRIHWANRRIYRNVSNSCQWVIGPSDAVTRNLAHAGIDRSKLRTVYNGIDLERFRDNQYARVESVRKELGLSPEDKAVGLFGQMLPYKGHRTLIEAAPQVLKTQPRTRFYFVGALENPVYEQELKAALELQELSKHFTFTGWRDDVQHVIRAMDVVVVATTTPEPAALMLMEAMAMERPVVATLTGGTPEIVADGETGLLFSPGDVATLARHATHLLANPEFARLLGLAGRRRVEECFSSERHLAAMFALYEQTNPAAWAPVNVEKTSRSI